MRLVFMGTPRFAVPSLLALVAAGESVAAVVTRPDRPRRHEAAPPGPSPIKVEARRLGLPLLQPEDVRDPGFVAGLRDAGPEVIAVVAFGRILPPAVLDLPPRGCVNVHASLLPRWRGAAPVARAIMAGDSRTGVTTMLMDAGIDTGDILLARDCDIGPLETAGELSDRLATLGAGLLVETLRAMEASGLPRTPQDPSGATLAPPLAREDGRLSWDAPAAALACRVRGCNPWPAAAAGLRGQRVQILRAVSTPPAPSTDAGTVTGGPGRVLEATGERLVVACGGDTRLLILELRFPGRRTMTARDAVNGRLIRSGDCFTPPPD